MGFTQRTEKFNPLLDIGCFRTAFMISTFLGTVMFIAEISYAVNAALFIWGSFLLVYHYIIKRQIRRISFAKYAVAFLLLGVVTALLRITAGWQGFALNIGYMLYCAFYLFLFYGMYSEQRQRVKREIFLTIKLLLAISTLCVIAGLVLLLIYRNALCVFGQHLLIYDNRFKGIFINANHCGFASFMSLIFCAVLSCARYLKDNGISAPPRALLIISAVANLLSMLLSASNAAALLLVATLAIFSLYHCFAGAAWRNYKQMLKRLAAFSACCLCLFAFVFARSEISSLFRIDSPPSSAIIGGDRIENIDEIAGDTRPDGAITFEHINPTLDSGRIRLYSKALGYAVKSPIFGSGAGNVLYIEYHNSNGKIVDFHNGYLTILVGNGLVGLVLFVLFGFRIAERMALRLIRSKRLRHHPLPIMFAFLCGYCVYAAVEPSLLYNPYYSIAIFWFILGAAYLLLQDSLGIEDHAAADEVRELYKIEPRA